MTSKLVKGLAALLATTVPLASASNVWTVNCAPLTQQRADPIIFPGQVSPHVHAVVGSTAFGKDMSGVNGAAHGLATTCDKFTDHSSYWSPQLYHMRADGKFEMMPSNGAVIYYNNYSCPYDASSPGVCGDFHGARAFPAGLKMVAGDTFRRSFDKADPWQAAILLESGNNGEGYGMPKTLDGQRLSGHVRFPSCWDGKNLDSPDHQSHVNYPDPKLGGDTQGGMCPESHPVALFNIGAEFGYDLNGVTDPSSLVFANGDTTGYGFHGDFYQGWTDLGELQKSFATCFDNGDCPWNSFGAPAGKSPNPTHRQPQAPPVAAAVEDIGLHGPIAKLPGNNPVYRAPALRLGRRVSASPIALPAWLKW